MWGKGIVKGLAVTWEHFWGKKETFDYPEVKLPMSERFRGGHLVFDPGKCIACQICAMQCPNKALKLTVKTGEDKKRHMEKYVHHIGRCLFCNVCLEVCPKQALSWDKNYELPCYDRQDLVYDAVEEAAGRGKRHG